MVDSGRNIFQLEVFQSKFALMAPWETSVFCALILSLDSDGTHDFHPDSGSREERLVVR
jgi:hypothetical protein